MAKNAEVELVEGGGRAENLANGNGSGATPTQTPLWRLVLACCVAGGVQYSWALQLSLLTPYVQTLGLPHFLSSIMWLCGPIAGFVVQPLCGMYSDRCRSRFGRRRPFIATGCLLIMFAVSLIAFSSDIGYAVGDTNKQSCSVYHGPRWRATVVFVAGFWMLDLSNNAVQGPARALMADLSGLEGCTAANAIYASWMALGNILGYASGASGQWHKWFPFLQNAACCEACANLKGAFLIAILFLGLCLTVTLVFAKETPLDKLAHKLSLKEQKVGFLDIFRAFKNLPPGMPSVLFVTSLTWLSWFPFILYDTDWMGREVYHGNPNGTKAETNAYYRGVRAGAWGLLFNSIVLAVSSFMIEPLCRKLTARVLWVISNFYVSIAMAAICIVGYLSVKDYHKGIQQAIGPDGDIRVAALTVFTALGFPLAVLYSVPFGVTAQLAARGGGGQGLCMGVLNISIVVPQVIISLSAGPWDALFGKGNIPAFALASAIAFVCGIVGLFMLPRLSRSSFKTSGLGGMH